MSLQIVESDDALNDVIDAADYIAAQRGLNTSDEFLHAVKQAYQLLASGPGIGALRDYTNPALAGMRMWPVPRFRKYLIFYVATEEQLRILRVLHGARDMQKLFGPEDEAEE